MSNDAQQQSGAPRFDPRFSPEFQPGYSGTDSAPPQFTPVHTTASRTTTHQADASPASAPARVPSPGSAAPVTATTPAAAPAAAPSSGSRATVSPGANPSARASTEPVAPPLSLAPPVSLLESDSVEASSDGRSVATQVLIAHARNPFIVALATVAVLSIGVGVWAYSSAYERYSSGNMFTSQADYVAWELMMRYAPLCGLFGVAILVAVLFSLARASFAAASSTSSPTQDGPARDQRPEKR